MHFDLVSLLQTIGLLGLFAMIFLESGMLIGFFFPGDSVLFTAGFLASQGFFNIWVLVIGCFIAAVAGDSIGYYLGHRYGRRLFTKDKGIFFNKEHLTRAEKFYEKHGGKTIILARFVPVIRAFAPVVAGIGKMNYATFITYNLIGGFLWAVCITFAGYYLGSMIPDVDKYLLPIVGAIILISISPGIYHALKDKNTRAKIIGLIPFFK